MGFNRVRSNLTVKPERKFEVRVKSGFENGFKFDEAVAKFA
ncbi:hypothetical protein [Campylobacter showae]|uniref:Uncharacterized protein n=1 Tax=Campylobacter showae RM3277 TaxID=553219 RepID=C6RCR0_9BACT|nr:hypothetical protein [Campylobacter showae]EET80768.1 hypothetical protein CAMSH0001_1496 [Campylobacter showae RM3277]